jgi:hypothetical protein
MLRGGYVTGSAPCGKVIRMGHERPARRSPTHRIAVRRALQPPPMLLAAVFGNNWTLVLRARSDEMACGERRACVAYRFKSFGREAGSIVCDREWIAVAAIAELELALEVGTPELVRAQARREVGSPGSGLRPLSGFLRRSGASLNCRHCDAC